MPALSGVSLLSFALNVPGPVAVARLVAEGAAAVKIEPPDGDPLTGYSRPWYDALHAGVTVVPLDLKSDAGRAALEPHLARADVALTSQRPGALARLGLAPAALVARHPHLRVVAIVGDTAAPEVPGHDVTYQAEAGLLRTDLPATFLADLAGAADAVTAVLLALREPAGACRVVGLRDALTAFAAPGRYGLTRPEGCFGGADPCLQRLRDDRRRGGGGRPRTALPRPLLCRARPADERAAARRHAGSHLRRLGRVRARTRRPPHAAALTRRTTTGSTTRVIEPATFAPAPGGWPLA